MLSLPKRMLVATVNIRSCSCNSMKFFGRWTSCLFDALISSTDIPRPWVRMSWRVRWRDFCSATQIGSTSAKEKREWLQINEPNYIFAISQRKTDLIQAMGFELDIEFLFGESHRLAVNYAFVGINQFVGDLVVVQSWFEKDLDGRFMKVLELIFACSLLFNHVL